MIKHSLPLPHVLHKPVRADGPPPMLVMLHGYGANEDDLFALAPYLDERLLVVCPRAPVMLMPGSYGWFEIAFTAAGIAYDPYAARLGRSVAAEFVAEAVRAYAADPARLIVGGFSQGASMAAGVSFARPELVAHVALLSGLVPDELADELPPPEQMAGKAFFVSHGTFDQVVPIGHGRKMRALLEGFPVDLTYREYPMGHEISAVCLRDLQEWVNARLGA